jgi:6-phosphogluconolactonase
VAQRGRFSLVLAGGRTPETTYRLLTGQESDWEHWHLFFGDERCLPPDHPERNSLLVARSLTDHVAIPPHQIHPIPAEQGPEQAAESYRLELTDSLPFDLVLLGLGEDGHTASLFPGHDHPDGPTVLPVHHAPKPPPDRVSLSAATLGNCRQLLFLVTGTGKQTAVHRWRQGEELPASRILPAGRGEILIDRDALP